MLSHRDDFGSCEVAVPDGMVEDTKVPLGVGEGHVEDDAPPDLSMLEESQIKVEKPTPTKRTRASRRNAVNQPAPEESPDMYASADANEVLIHPDLRDSTGTAPTANMMSDLLPPQPIMHGHTVMMHTPVSVEEDYSDRKPKRELSQSKRAAQNRAAQRAFRQRKEGYIKKLEVQVRDYNQLESSYKNLQMENYALREYVHVLQNRLMEAHAECPPPPPNLDLNQQHNVQELIQPSNDVDMPMTDSMNDSMNDSINDTVSLDVVAQAVVGLAAHQVHLHREQQYPDQALDQALPPDDIHKLLQVDSQ